MYFKDLEPHCYAPERHTGFKVKAVGWLGSKVHRIGKTDDKILLFLKEQRQNNSHDDYDLGSHECEICNKYSDRGDIWIETNLYRYVMPRMIVHYIEKHSYKLPIEAEEVILNVISKGS